MTIFSFLRHLGAVSLEFVFVRRHLFLRMRDADTKSLLHRTGHLTLKILRKE